MKEIKTLLAKGFNCTYISELYNVHRKTINDIKLKKTNRNNSQDYEQHVVLGLCAT